MNKGTESASAQKEEGRRPETQAAKKLFKRLILEYGDDFGNVFREALHRVIFDYTQLDTEACKAKADDLYILQDLYDFFGRPVFAEITCGTSGQTETEAQPKNE